MHVKRNFIAVSTRLIVAIPSLALKSDTVEERTLKKVNLLKREKARKAIMANAKIALADPKKKAREGFEVGTMEELIEQAKNGGSRLPGTVSVSKVMS